MLQIRQAVPIVKFKAALVIFPADFRTPATSPPATSAVASVVFPADVKSLSATYQTPPLQQ